MQYKENFNQAPVFINGKLCGVFGEDYGFPMNDGEKNVGINHHLFSVECRVPENRLQPLDDRYAVFVDGQREENMKMYVITFDVDVLLDANKSFYIVPGNVIGKNERYVVTKNDSKNAFLHEQGHHEIVEHCFRKNGGLHFSISVERPFSGNSAQTMNDNAWTWVEQMIGLNERSISIRRMIREKIEDRFNKINGNKNVNGKDSYYHDIYGNRGNPWKQNSR